MYSCFCGDHDFYELKYSAQLLAVLINRSAPPKCSNSVHNL